MEWRLLLPILLLLALCIACPCLLWLGRRATSAAATSLTSPDPINHPEGDTE